MSVRKQLNNQLADALLRKQGTYNYKDSYVATNYDKLQNTKKGERSPMSIELSVFFCEILRELRTKHDLTGRELAQMLGVQAANIHKWEAGKAFPNFVNLARLAAIFDVPISTFFPADLRKVRMSKWAGGGFLHHSTNFAIFSRRNKSSRRKQQQPHQRGRGGKTKASPVKKRAAKPSEEDPRAAALESMKKQVAALLRKYGSS